MIETTAYTRNLTNQKIWGSRYERPPYAGTFRLPGSRSRTATHSEGRHMPFVMTQCNLSGGQGQRSLNLSWVEYSLEPCQKNFASLRSCSWVSWFIRTTPIRERLSREQHRCALKESESSVTGGGWYVKDKIYRLIYWSRFMRALYTTSTGVDPQM